MAVTPFVGVWIETGNSPKDTHGCIVTPFVGVWIETPSHMIMSIYLMSHPSWVCGLKR